MLKVECEACKAPYQVDERRVPPTGLKMRCPKCGHAFTVAHPDAAVASAPMSKHTIMGVAAPGGGIAPKPPAAPPPAPAIPDDFDVDLPQAAVPKAAPPKPAAPRPAPPKPPPPKAKAVPLPSAPGLGEIDELLDLPAMPAPPPAGAVKPFAPVKPTLVSSQGGGPAPKPPAPSLSDYDIDLPSATADLPAKAAPKPAKPAAAIPMPVMDGDLPAPKAAKPAKPAGAIPMPVMDSDLPAAKPAAARAPAVGGALGFDVDLPSPAGSGADLPAAKGRGGAGGFDLPAAKGGRGSGGADLPARRDEIGLPAAFGEIGLPAPAGGVGLPAVSGNVGLPSLSGNVGLPAPAGGGFGSIDFPSLGASPGLPAPVDQDRYLPRASGSGSNLPAALGGDMHLPAVQDALPAALGDASFLPSNAGTEMNLDGGGGSGMSFGEADFGDLGAPAASPSKPAVQAVPGGQGGVGFGELDFGGDGGDVAVEADMAAPPVSMREAGGEAALPTDDAPVKRRDRVVIAKGQSRGQKIALAGIAVAILAGASLQLTSYGAFGYHTINDSLHKSEWSTAAADSLAKARKAFEADLYDKARASADAVALGSAGVPRSHAFAAAAALAEFEFQTRFGRDAARATRAEGWLTAIKAAEGNAASIPYFNAAAGARAVASGDLVGARALLDAAAQKDPGDPYQEDVAFVRGELELKAKDGPAAVKAFSRALQVAPSARAHYGLARAYALGGAAPAPAPGTAAASAGGAGPVVDKKKVLAEIAATLAATPNHPGALILKASFDWADDRNDVAVLDGLKPILEGPAKATASAVELSRAYTLHGLAQASRGDVGSARVAFDSALKLDGTNVEALLGQGEVFFADGRYSEALSRFDTAVQSDPTNPTAIIADAKGKMALERLADAKTQLAAAQKAMPKSMLIVYWLGRAEEKLGNKKEAEDAYVGAIALVSPKDRDAIQPYVALSGLLAGQGRATEAQAKLNDAKAKLPDSAAMQRALGEVAAAQGLYDEALTHYQTAAERDPHDLRARFQLGQTYLRMHRLEDATAQFDKVAAVDPDYPNLAMERGNLLEQSGHVDQALSQFKAALDRAPNDLDLQLRVGAAYVGIGRGEEALKTLKPVYDVRQNSAEVNHYLGRAHLLLGGPMHLIEARRYLQKAVDIEPTRADYHVYLAWVATAAQDWTLGTVEVEKAIQLDALLGDAYWQRAVIEEVKASVDDAIRDATKALVLHPARVEAHATLAKCYGDKNQVEKALAEWAIATSHSSGDHPEWDYLYGRMLFERGSLAQALPHVLLAAKAAEATTPPPVWAESAEFMTASALLKAGNKTDAKEHFIRFLQSAPQSSPDYKDAKAAMRSIDPEYQFR